MRRILLVDDDTGLREALQAALASHGRDVSGAKDGIAALRAAVDSRPEVIISDVNMPLLRDRMRSEYLKPCRCSHGFLSS
jgi:DNA-binding response OmpR family regulator